MVGVLISHGQRIEKDRSCLGKSHLVFLEVRRCLARVPLVNHGRSLPPAGTPTSRTLSQNLVVGALRSHRDVCGPGFGFGYAKTFLTQTLDMKLDGFMHERFDLLYGGRSGDATIKVGRKR